MRWLLVFVAVLICNLLATAGVVPDDQASRNEAEVESPANSDESRDSVAEEVQPRSKRILVVTSADCLSCAEALRELESAKGPFELLRQRGWKIGAGADNHIQVIALGDGADSDVALLLTTFRASNGPVVVCVESGQVTRSFHGGCTTPLDQWTFGWLMTGNDQRPIPYQPTPVAVATTGRYPLRGNHWSVEGNLNPTREYTIQHLRSVHSGELQADWNIESWSLEELRSVHDDLHERAEGFRGRTMASSSAPGTSSVPGMMSSRSSRSGSIPSKALGGNRTPGR